MNRTLSGIARLLVAFLATIPSLDAKASTGVEIQPGQRVKAFLIDARLRSAFIQRLTGLQFSPPSATMQERTRELQRHFDAVVGLLEANRQRSVNLALQRLEERRGEDWDAQTRLSWKKWLEGERQTNIRRLERYRDRGLFPFNQHVAGRAVPVFVDNDDTACAVGHLMRLSGWDHEVATIQAASNLVYVNDVSQGPLVDWVATSGLTQEEAALIQPAYEPPLEDATFQELMMGATISHNGLRYENFQMMSGIVPFWPDSAQFSVVATPFNPTIVGVSAHDEIYISPSGPGMKGQFDDWLFLGSTVQFPTFEEVAQAPVNGAMQLGYSFEVVAEQPGALIDAATLESIAIFNFNRPGNGSILVTSVISDPLAPGMLTTLVIASDPNTPYYLGDSDVGSFAPKTRIKVATFIELWNGAQFTSLTYSFNAIPEPASASLFLVGCALMMKRRRGRRHGGVMSREEG